MENGDEQVTLEFTLRGNCFTQIHYRTLQYGGQDYLAGDAPLAVKQIAGQFDALLAYLVGKPVAAVNDLYRTAGVVADVDAGTGATLRAPKVISAIWDGLNRRTFRID